MSVDFFADFNLWRNAHHNQLALFFGKKHLAKVGIFAGGFEDIDFEGHMSLV